MRHQGSAEGNEPRPVPDPAPLVWIGGGSDKAVERAARWGDGWCPFFSEATQSKLNQDTGLHTLEQLAGKIAMLNDLRAGLNKSGPFDVAIGPRAKLRYCENGGADGYLDAIDELKEAGVTWAMVAFVEYAMDRPSRYQLLFAMQPIEPEADMMDGYLRPAYRQVIETLEEHVAAGGYLPAKDLMSAALLVISLTHGRIALAHLAPNRRGNSMRSVSKFVAEHIERAFRGAA